MFLFWADTLSLVALLSSHLFWFIVTWPQSFSPTLIYIKFVYHMIHTRDIYKKGMDMDGHVS